MAYTFLKTLQGMSVRKDEGEGGGGEVREKRE